MSCSVNLPNVSWYGQMLSLRNKKQENKSLSNSSLNGSYIEDEEFQSSKKLGKILAIEIESKQELAEYLKGKIIEEDDEYLSIKVN